MTKMVKYLGRSVNCEHYTDLASYADETLLLTIFIAELPLVV